MTTRPSHLLYVAKNILRASVYVDLYVMALAFGEINTRRVSDANPAVQLAIIRV